MTASGAQNPAPAQGWSASPIEWRRSAAGYMSKARRAGVRASPPRFPATDGRNFSLDAEWRGDGARPGYVRAVRRRLIGQRTKEALAAEKAAGIRLGRPPTVHQSMVRRMQRQWARGTRCEDRR